jgi:hypothetical protein
MELSLSEKPSIVLLLKNFPLFYGTWRFVTVFPRALHWSLFWARLIQSIPSHYISLRSILIFSTHLSLGLLICLVHFALFLAFIFSPIMLNSLPISSSLTWLF